MKEQLSDDPRFARATEADLTKAIKECQKTFLDPLACVDRYLKQFGREGLYRTISKGMSDPEGRWQAFIDYSYSYLRYFNNPKRRIEFGIEDDEIGVIEEVAFDIIRLRAVPGMPKVHLIMRELPKYCRTTNGKKAVKKIAEEVDPILPRNDLFDANNEPLSLEEADDKWAARNKEHITYNLRKAARSHEHLKDRETPIGLLEAALKKLTHDEMDLTTIRTEDYGKARALAADIQKKANELERQIYSHQKQFKKLLNKA